MDTLFPDQDWMPHQPASNDDLWRYIDFTQFVSILENESLWFAQAAEFFDPYEGALPQVKLDELTEAVPDEVDKPRELVARMYDALRRATYVSCWHQRPGESASMWQLYQGKGKEVAIRTTLADFEEAFRGDPEMRTGYVKYDLDYSDPQRFAVDRVAPFFYKRPSFRHEEEFRAVISEFQPPDAAVIDDGFADTVDANTPSGKPVAVDPTTLIDDVVVSPVAGSWLEDLVEDVLHRYGLDDVTVSPSALNDEPFE